MEDSENIDDLLRELTSDQAGSAASFGRAQLRGAATGGTQRRTPPAEEQSLPTFHGRPIQEPPERPVVDVPPASTGDSLGGPQRWQIVLVAGILLVAVAGLIGWLAGRSQGSPTDTEDVAIDSGVAESQTSDGGASSSGAAESTDAPTTTVDPAASDGSTVASPTTEPFVASSTPDNPYGAAQYIVVSKGVSHFRGWYPSQEVVDGMIAGAIELVGPENVVDETEIHPDAPLDFDEIRVYYEDPVLFDVNSTRIASDFAPHLDAVGYALLGSPDLTITVIARTDATGSASYNLELSTGRAQAVASHWIAMGVEANRISLDPRGERDANPDAGPEEAVFDRSVEMVIKGQAIGS